MKHAHWSIKAAVIGSALAVSASPAFAKSFKVGPGQDYSSIQAAVDDALDGDKVIVYPGTYQEPHANPAAVTITKSLKLVGKENKKLGEAGRVVIVPNPGQLHGILVEGSESLHIDGIQIKKMTVQGFEKNGIWLRYVDNFKIDSNRSIDNGENGIWPTLSANGLVKKNVSYGSDDSALWVEGADNVRVLSNELYDSVTGLELTISSNVEMSKNVVYNNTVGVGIYHPNGAGMPIPTEITTGTGGWELNKNHVYDNNRPNSAPPASLAGALPPGGGVLVLGTDGLTAKSNLIEDNDFYGVAMVDYCAAVDGGPSDCDIVPPIVQGFPELNRFEKTELNRNGTAPDPGHPLAAYAADVTYIGTDIFAPYSGPYSPNTVCGTTPSTFTKGGLGSPNYREKC